MTVSSCRCSEDGGPGLSRPRTGCRGFLRRASFAAGSPALARLCRPSFEELLFRDRTAVSALEPRADRTNLPGCPCRKPYPVGERGANWVMLIAIVDVLILLNCKMAPTAPAGRRDQRSDRSPSVDNTLGHDARARIRGTANPGQPAARPSSTAHQLRCRK